MNEATQSRDPAPHNLPRRPALDWIAARSALLRALLPLALAACGSGPTEAPLHGAQLRADRDTLVRWLAELQSFEGSRLARESAALLDALPDCAVIESRSERADLSALRAGLRCAGAAAAPGAQAPAVSLRWALADGGEFTGHLETNAADWRLDLAWPAPQSGIAALLRPAPQPSGAGWLNSDEGLVHLRLRPAQGIDIAALIESGSQADRMFRLKSSIFSRALLDGVLESAIYLPAATGAEPRAVLALGISQPQLAAEAMARFVDDLEATWPVQRSAFEIGSNRGACLLDLQVLPGLAPCYVVHPDALLLGWNPASLRHALAAGSRAAFDTDGGLRIELARLPAADARLAGFPDSGEAPAAPRALPWQRIRARSEDRGDTLAIRVEIESAQGAARRDG